MVRGRARNGGGWNFLRTVILQKNFRQHQNNEILHALAPVTGKHGSKILFKYAFIPIGTWLAKAPAGFTFRPLHRFTGTEGLLT